MIQKSLIISFLALITVIGYSYPASAQTEAPFGLFWGATVEETRSLGIELTEIPENNFGSSFIASSMPKVLSDQRTTILSFGYNDKLWRILGAGKYIENDPHGYAIKNRYQDLQKILSEKYGKPIVNHSLGGSIYSEPEYFVAGIRSGESFWFSDFDETDIYVQLGVTASRNSTSNWRIIYEFIPLKKKFEVDHKNFEKGAL